MGRNARASSSKLPTTNGKNNNATRKPIARKPEPQPETESDDEELDEDDLLDEPEEVEGIAQYAPDDWDGEGQSDSGSDDGSDRSDSEAGSASESEDDGQDDLRKLQENLRSMPLSTLMKAQRSLNPQPEESDDSGSEAESGPSTIKAKRLAEAKKRLAEMQRRKGKAGGIAVPALDDLEDEEGSEDEFEDMRQTRGGGNEERQRKERVKRDNKHAPTAMSTKKQVSRTRLVVEGIPKKDRRDPRFDTMSSSSIDPHLASQSYSFLPNILKDDLSALRTAVQMAQKAERTCPLAQKPARVAEREMLEMQLGKLRTKIERGEREAKEREVLAGAKREENSKRKEGKGAWYMKKNEQKELLLKARFEHLNEQGGQRAVKKAIEKKRKKTASKEKKSRPFARGQGQGGPGAGGGGGGEGAKRRRVA